MIVIGKNSNLTHELEKKYDNIISFSSTDILINISLLDKYIDDDVVFLFNNFQAAKYIKDISNIQNYIERSLLVTAKVLDFIKKFKKIRKIIYTSSSSVYGDNKFCSEKDIPHPINLQASLKLSNEFFIKYYCQENKIDYTILRIFNMYGGVDNFSVISKIIEVIKQNKELTLINSGKGVRDFIHIDDVVTIILKLLILKNINIINIGTGKGKSIKGILDYLEKDSNIKLKTINIPNDNEIKVSVANIKKLTQIENYQFIQVEKYILEEIHKKVLPI